MRRHKIQLLALLAAIVCAQQTAAYAAYARGRAAFSVVGTASTTHGTPIGGGARAFTLLPGNRAILIGDVQHNRLAVVRIKANGTPDLSFGIDASMHPVVPAPFQAIQVLRQPDGKLLIVGTSTTNGQASAQLTLIRLTRAGLLDASFGHGGIERPAGLLGGCTNCRTAALEPDGEILLAASSAAGGDFVVARLTADGALDATYATGGIAKIAAHAAGYAVAALPSGAALALGVGIQPAESHPLLARLTPTGQLDSSFAGGQPIQLPLPSATQMLDTPDGGALVLGGAANEATRTAASGGPDEHVLRYGPNGARDTSYAASTGAGLGQSMWAEQILPAPGAGALVIGTPEPSPPDGTKRIEQLTPSGQIDRATTVDLGFGGGIVGIHGGGALQQDGFSGSAALRADGTLLFAGGVTASQSATKRSAVSFNQFAAAALDHSFALDKGFGLSRPPGFGVELRPQRVDSKQGVRVVLSPGLQGLGTVKLRVGSVTIARSTLALLSTGPAGHYLPLDADGLALLKRPGARIKVTADASFRDMAGNVARARSSATLTPAQR